jgi:nicotinamidase-related amidase
MKTKERLDPRRAALLILDVQEKLFPHVDHPCEVMEKMTLLIQGIKLLDLPIIATEQYPQGLGPTIKPLRDLIGQEAFYPAKTSFSALGDPQVNRAVEELGRSQWIVMGIEAHVCVLQTVRDLIGQGKEVIVVNDAITSRSVYDFSSAIAEMRDMGARIATTETVLFELLGDAKHPKFKAFSALIR